MNPRQEREQRVPQVPFHQLPQLRTQITLGQMEPKVTPHWGPLEECPAGSWLGVKCPQEERNDSRPRPFGKGKLLFSFLLSVN